MLIYKPNMAEDLCEAIAWLMQTVGEKSKSSAYLFCPLLRAVFEAFVVDHRMHGPSLKKGCVCPGVKVNESMPCLLSFLKLSKRFLV